MSEQEEDQPITEEEFARMLAEQDAQDQAPEEAAVEEPEPEAEVEPEPPELEPEAEPVIPGRPGEPDEQPELPPEELELPAGEEPAEHIAWAQRRNLTDFESAAKLAFEQEKFLGRKSSEIEALREQLREVEQQVGQPAPPPRSEQWIAAALSSPDPARYAWELAEAGDWATYQQYMGMWEQIVGESVTMSVHQQILTGLEEQEQREPDEPGTPENAIQDAFAAVGVYDLQNDPLVPTIRQVADEMGGKHPLVEAAARGDATAIAAIVEIARSRTYTTRTVRLDGTPVEDEDRKRASAVTGSGGSPTRTPPKEDPLAADREQWRRMGVLPVE